MNGSPTTSESSTVRQLSDDEIYDQDEKIDDETFDDDEKRDDVEERDDDTKADEDVEAHTPVAQDGAPAEVVEDDFPDGGMRAWFVAIGAASCSFSTFGLVNSWGVFQSYYEQTLLRDVSPSSIAWIGSLQYALILLPGLLTGRMFDLGHFKTPFLIASVILVAATMLVAECTEYWQFLLCQGVLTGLACGTIFGPAMGVIGHWFKRKRGLALAINGLGSATGGTVFPIAVRQMIQRVGFSWTMRITALIIILTLGIAFFAMTRRLPPKNVSGGLFNLAAFKSAPFSIYVASTVAAFAGIYTMLTYIDIGAQSVGISADFSFYLVSIANASSNFGRMTSGVLVDRFGAINAMAPMSVAAAALTFAWPFARTKPALIAAAVLYGFTSGAYVATFLAPLYELGATADVGRRTGMAMTLAAAGALAGPPISGAINYATGGFIFVGVYAGGMILFSVVLMLTVRQLVLRKLWGKF